MKKPTIKFRFNIEQCSDKEFIVVRKMINFLKVKCEDNNGSEMTLPICEETDTFFK